MAHSVQHRAKQDNIMVFNSTYSAIGPTLTGWLKKKPRDSLKRQALVIKTSSAERYPLFRSHRVYVMWHHLQPTASKIFYFPPSFQFAPSHNLRHPDSIYLTWIKKNKEPAEFM